jgi:hypothetical protein
MTPRFSQKRTETNTTATYKIGTAISKLVTVSAANIPAAIAKVRIGRTIELFRAEILVISFIFIFAKIAIGTLDHRCADAVLHYCVLIKIKTYDA